jgi:hypothetical protein
VSSPIYDQHHAVQFYGDDTTLFESVAAFLGQGFLDGQPAIVIATMKHQAGILSHLEQRMIDVARAQRLGDLVVLDAHVTLQAFMNGDAPDRSRFEKAVVPLLAQMASSRARGTCVRAYGEMVDVLWQQGRSEAAIRLESFWNELANRHGFALLCGYAMRNFQRDTRRFEEVCRQHTHVMPARPAH